MDSIFGGINSLLGGLWEIVWFIITAPFALLTIIIGVLFNIIEYLLNYGYIVLTIIVAVIIFIKKVKVDLVHESK